MNYVIGKVDKRARRAPGWAGCGGAEAVHRVLRGSTVQAKLKIGAPNDAYEREADAVAARVMRMATPQADETSLLQRREDETVRRFCAECEEELQRQPLEEPEEEELLAKRAAGEEDVPAIEGDLETRIHGRRGGGQPLPESARAFFEPRFGHDFSRVRVHTDLRSAEAARAINARAFTIGRHVVFGRGQYSPGTTDGKQLLAHELTHVVQQGESNPTPANEPSFLRQSVAGKSAVLADEERALAQGISRVGGTVIQRATAWVAGAVHETLNPALIVNGLSGAPITWEMLNGTKLTTAAAAVGAINSPTVSPTKSGATWKAKVTSVPMNKGSFDETVLAKGPWTTVLPKATVGANWSLPKCTGKGNTTFRAKGKPSDNHVFNANRRHEDQHANFCRLAFDANIVAWDTKVTKAKNNGTEFGGGTAAKATASLWAAMGGTPADVAKAYHLDVGARGAAFHAMPKGGPMTAHNPGSDKTCATSWVEIKNPS